MANSADLVSATPLARCALAIALPLDRQAFLADVTSEPEKDYVRGMLRGRQPEAAWEEDGQPLAELCGELLALSRRLGVKTVCCAGLSDIACLFGDSEVVTIVAHWRGAAFFPGDFIQDPATLIEKIRSGDDALCFDLAQRLQTTDIDVLLALHGNRQRARFAEILNEIAVNSDRPLPNVLNNNAGMPVVLDELSLRSLQRARLDAAFPNFLKPGNRLELRSGMHSPAEIAASMSDAWIGIVDFAICQSAYLAHAVKNNRAHRRIITNQHAVVPGIRLRIQKELYRRLKTGGNYASELMALYVALTELRRPAQAIGIWQRLHRGLLRRVST
jgi:hypothetical protein